MMKKFFRNIVLRIYVFFHTMFLKISIALYNTEQETLKADMFLDDDQNKHIIRKKHHNPVLEKMFQGQRDENYIKEYYEILKKADKFLRNATPEQIEMAVDKHGMNLGQKDRWGRRYEHFGFYDPKHKNYGKTLGEAMQDEVKERTTDDDFQILYMFDNRPIEDGLAKTQDIKETHRGVEALNEYEKAKVKKFPMKVTRDKDVPNKIEQITDFLHVKRIDDDHRILEFFIPKKYRLFENLNNKIIFDEIISIWQVWIKDEYDGKYGFSIQEYDKYFDYDEIYDVLKFKATAIININ